MLNRNFFASLIHLSIASVLIGGTLSVPNAFAANACIELFKPAHATLSHEDLVGRFKSAQDYLNSEVIGEHELIEKIMISLLVRGHILLEGHPGSGKTLLARETGKVVAGDMKRIQFTPDLMPGDVTGSEVVNPHTQQRHFNPGPLFANVVLADEINRATPKTQSALLQAMGERTITLGLSTHELDGTFFVIATQNPHDGKGTFPLPEAQLDRFLFKVKLDYPEYADEMRIMDQNVSLMSTREKKAKPTAHLSENVLDQARHEIDAVDLGEREKKFILTLVRATRKNEVALLSYANALKSGAGPRAPIQIAQAVRARAWMHGRSQVTIADIQALAPDILAHRVAVADQTTVQDSTEAREIVETMIELKL